MARSFFPILLISLMASPSWGAQTGLSKTHILGDSPTQVEAENGIQCDKDNKICKAFKAVVAHNDLQLRSRLLKIYFDDKDDLERVEAYGNVHLSRGKMYKATGNHGSLDLKTGIIILEKNAHAHDLENKRSLKAENIKLTLQKGAKDQLTIHRVDAHTHVQIKTPKEVAYADKGAYVSGKDFITLAGNVKITNKDGQMTGDRAEMNLKTGLSQLKSSKGPVRVYLKSKSALNPPQKKFKGQKG